MNREIKFRAWDNNQKRFYYLDLNNGCDFTPEELKQVQQFTGLKDCKGKEIYEGDIIRNDANKKHQVEWNKYWGGYEPFLSGAMSDWSTEIIEAIGNIYENPELLEA